MSVFYIKFITLLVTTVGKMMYEVGTVIITVDVDVSMDDFFVASSPSPPKNLFIQ